MSTNQMLDEIRALIKSEMKQQKVSQNWLSAKTGLAPATIHAFIHGERECNVRTVAIILDALGYKLMVSTK